MLLIKKFHKISLGSTLYFINKTYEFYPYHHIILNNIDERIQINKYHLNDKYDSKGVYYKECLITLTFNNPGLYLINIEDNESFMKHRVEIDCFNNTFMKKNNYDEILQLHSKNTLRDEFENFDLTNCDYIEDLKRNGHTCIKITHNFPTKFTWCNNKTCINITDHDCENIGPVS